MKVGTWLLEKKRSQIKINEIAKMLNVNRRTLSNWKYQAKTVSKKEIGRPRYRQSQKFKALLKVGREWKRQGCPGWRPVAAALKCEVPTRLVQSHLKNLKLQKRQRLAKRLKTRRTSVKVNYKDVYWSQDGVRYNSKSYQIIKDRASHKILSIFKSESENTDAIIQSLKQAQQKRELPMVLSTDNGSGYISKRLKSFLERNYIIHLKSLPMTPQHNGAVECAIREITEAATQTGNSLESAVEIINQNRLRASFLFKSAALVDDKLGESYSKVDRKKFYEICKDGIRAIEAVSKNWRSRRMLERKLILKTLQQYGLITLNEGSLS